MRKGVCKHFTGIQNKTCELGIKYDDVTTNPKRPGSGYRQPCVKDISEYGKRCLKEFGPQGTCNAIQRAV